MTRLAVGVLDTAIIAIYAIGSGRLVTTDTQWYRSLSKPAWQPPGIVVGLIWPYNFAMLIVATWVVANRLSSTPAGLVDFARAERGSRSLVGMVVLYSTLTARISCCTHARHPVHHPATRDLVSRVSRTWHCVRAVPTVASPCYVSRFWVLLTMKTAATSLLPAR